MARNRKARNDRTHLLYCITNIITNEQYVGLTVKVGTTRKSALVRIQKHIRRAKTENRDWALCVSIRTYGEKSFTYGVIETIRGKLAAHRRELEIIHQYNPALNTAK